MTPNPGPHRIRPVPPLSSFVDSFWIYEGYIQAHARERVLPTGTMQLVFTLDADGRLAASVAGPRSHFVELDTSRPFSAIGVHFRPGGGFPFFAVPSGELHNRTVSLESLWGRSGDGIQDRLWSASPAERRFAILESALIERMGSRSDRHSAVRYAIDRIVACAGTHAVGEIVQTTGLSPRRFAELFRDQVGLPPKVFSRIRRLDAALRRIERAGEVDWTDVALSCGFFDQAHFNHDFRAFCGLNPSAYLRHRTARTHVAVPD
jgi:AraC-like DNA-binding protein